MALAIPSPAFAGDFDREGYYPFGSDSTGTALYAETEEWMEIWADSVGVELWIYADHSRDATTTSRTSVFLMKLNCPAKTYKIETSISHDARGNPMRTPNYAVTYSYARAIPGTVAYAILEASCTEMAE